MEKNISEAGFKAKYLECLLIGDGSYCRFKPCPPAVVFEQEDWYWTNSKKNSVGHCPVIHLAESNRKILTKILNLSINEFLPWSPNSFFIKILLGQAWEPLLFWGSNCLFSDYGQQEGKPEVLTKQKGVITEVIKCHKQVGENINFWCPSTFINFSTLLSQYLKGMV